MADKDDSILFQIGQMAGQLNAVNASVLSIQGTLVALETRLREQEKQSTRTATIIGLVGVIAGGMGSFVMNIMRAHV